jgi:hypothetical protein
VNPPDTGSKNLALVKGDRGARRFAIIGISAIIGLRERLARGTEIAEYQRAEDHGQ